MLPSHRRPSRAQSSAFPCGALVPSQTNRNGLALSLQCSGADCEYHCNSKIYGTCTNCFGGNCRCVHAALRSATALGDCSCRIRRTCARAMIRGVEYSEYSGVGRTCPWSTTTRRATTRFAMSVRYPEMLCRAGYPVVWDPVQLRRAMIRKPRIASSTGLRRHPLRRSRQLQSAVPTVHAMQVNHWGPDCKPCEVHCGKNGHCNDGRFGDGKCACNPG